MKIYEHLDNIALLLGRTTRSKLHQKHKILAFAIGIIASIGSAALVPLTSAVWLKIREFQTRYQAKDVNFEENSSDEEVDTEEEISSDDMDWSNEEIDTDENTN